jgi:hypothetical protein
MHNAINIKPRDLPEDQSKALLELIDELDFDELPEELKNNPSLPDQFTYKISVVTKDGEHSVTTGDASAPEKLQELVQLLNRIARQQARKK